MIVKSGRLYLGYNDISAKELIIKVGSGSGSSEYLEIDQTDLANENTDATVKVTTEADYDLGVDDSVRNADVGTDTIADITSHIFDDERKIIIYVMIKAEAAFELGEMGLFVKQSSEAFNDGVGETIPTSPLENPVEGNVYFNTEDNLLYTYTSGTGDSGNIVPTAPQDVPTEGEMYYNDTIIVLYTYTSGEGVEAEIFTSRPASPDEGDVYLDTVDNLLYTYTSGAGDTGNNIPTAPQDVPTEGEMYYNDSTIVLYTYTSGAGVRETVSTSQPESPDEGDIYFNTADSSLQTYIVDTGVVDSTTSFTKPSTPAVEETWFDTTDYTLYTFTADVNHNYPEVMISRNLMTKQFISTTETKIIKYTINI